MIRDMILEKDDIRDEKSCPISNTTNLFLIIKNELNIDDIVDEILENIFKNIKQLPVDKITRFIDIAIEYFRNNEIIPYLNTKSGNCYKYPLKSIVPFVEYDSMIDYIELDEFDDELTNETLVKHLEIVFNDNVSYLETFKNNILDNNSYRNCVIKLYELKHYLITLEHYLSRMMHNYHISSYATICSTYISSVIERDFNLLLINESNLVRRNSSLLSIKEFHKRTLGELDNKFLELVTEFKSNLDGLAEHHIENLLKVKEKIANEFPDSDKFVTTGKDYIQMMSVFNSCMENYNWNSDIFVQPGNTYNKSALLSFIDNSITSINYNKDSWDNMINNMNICISDKIENMESSIFEDDKIYLFVFDDKMTQDDLQKYATQQDDDYIEKSNGDNITNKYLSLLDSMSIEYTTDDSIRFDLETIKEFNRKFTTLYSSIIEFLYSKLSTIKESRIFNLEDIMTLSEKYPELISDKVIPLKEDYCEKYILGMNSDENIIIVDPGNLSKRQVIDNSLFDFIMSEYKNY